jgi:ubiquitin-protein ligase
LKIHRIKIQIKKEMSEEKQDAIIRNTISVSFRSDSEHYRNQVKSKAESIFN